LFGGKGPDFCCTGRKKKENWRVSHKKGGEKRGKKRKNPGEKPDFKGGKEFLLIKRRKKKIREGFFRLPVPRRFLALLLATKKDDRSRYLMGKKQLGKKKKTS